MQTGWRVFIDLYLLCVASSHITRNTFPEIVCNLQNRSINEYTVILLFTARSTDLCVATHRQIVKPIQTIYTREHLYKIWPTLRHTTEIDIRLYL